MPKTTKKLSDGVPEIPEIPENEGSPGSSKIEIVCKDGVVYESMFVLSYCSKYPIHLHDGNKWNNSFHTCRTTTITIDALFHDKLNGRKQTVQFSDLLDVWNCCLKFGRDPPEVIQKFNITGECDDYALDILGQSDYCPTVDMLNVMTPRHIAGLFREPKILDELSKNVDKLSTEKIYAIYKACTGKGPLMRSMHRAAIHFTAADFINFYRTMVWCMEQVDMDNAGSYVILLRACAHLRDDPLLKEHWKVLTLFTILAHE